MTFVFYDDNGDDEYFMIIDAFKKLKIMFSSPILNSFQKRCEINDLTRQQRHVLRMIVKNEDMLALLVKCNKKVDDKYIFTLFYDTKTELSAKDYINYLNNVNVLKL